MGFSGGLKVAPTQQEVGGASWVCLLPGNEAISKGSIICLCFCRPFFFFLFIYFSVCAVDRFKAAFPEALSRQPGGGGGGPNLILRSSNIPQSNITRLRSYHIQRDGGGQYFSIILLLFLSSKPPPTLAFFSLPRLRALIGPNERTSVKC